MSGARRHICPTCKMGFRVPAELRRHLARLTPCAPVIEADSIGSAGGQFPCHFCGKRFTQRAHVTRHKKSSCMISPEGKNGKAGMEILAEHVRARDSDSSGLLAEYSSRLKGLEEMVRRLTLAAAESEAASAPALTATHVQCAAPSVLINGDNARVLQVIVDQPAAPPKPSNFGREDISHLQRKDVLKIFSAVAPSAEAQIIYQQARGELDTPAGDTHVRGLCDQLVTHAAMLIYSDPQHAHNITCYLPRQHDKAAMTRDDDEWVLSPVNIVFPPMVRRAISLLFDQQPIAGVDFTSSGPGGSARSTAYGTLLTYLSKHEADLSLDAGRTMRPILTRNADLLQKLRVAIGGAPDTKLADLVEHHN